MDTRHRRRVVIVSIVVLVVIIVAVGLAYSVNLSPRTNTNLQTTSTTYPIVASDVISGTVQQDPGGYVASTSRELRPSSLGALSAGYAVLGQPDSSANITVIVFDQNSHAETHYLTFRSNVQGLPGYTDISSAVSAYQSYGPCYGHGEDVDGIAVVDGICVKGNVFLEVHISSSNDFATVQSDLGTLMGAAYSSVN